MVDSGRSMALLNEGYGWGLPIGTVGCADRLEYTLGGITLQPVVPRVGGMWHSDTATSVDAEICVAAAAKQRRHRAGLTADTRILRDRHARRGRNHPTGLRRIRPW